MLFSRVSTNKLPIVRTFTMVSTFSDKATLKDQFVNEVGEDALDEGWQTVLRLNPELFNASLNLRSVPRKKRHLPLKVQHLISIAVDSASTHLYVPGIQTHVKQALKEGATAAEIMEVIELTSTLGIHACNIGVPLLVEVMKEEGIYATHPTAGARFDERREKLRADFTQKRGYWHQFWEDFLKLDPEFFEAYVDFSTVSWTKNVDGSEKGALEPKVSPAILRLASVAHAFLDQRVDLLRLRCSGNASVPARAEAPHEERDWIRCNARRDHRGTRDRDTVEPAHCPRRCTNSCSKHPIAFDALIPN